MFLSWVVGNVVEVRLPGYTVEISAEWRIEHTWPSSVKS